MAKFDFLDLKNLLNHWATLKSFAIHTHTHMAIQKPEIIFLFHLQWCRDACEGRWGVREIKSASNRTRIALRKNKNNNCIASPFVEKYERKINCSCHFCEQGRHTFLPRKFILWWVNEESDQMVGAANVNEQWEKRSALFIAFGRFSPFVRAYIHFVWMKFGVAAFVAPLCNSQVCMNIHRSTTLCIFFDSSACLLFLLHTLCHTHLNALSFSCFPLSVSFCVRLF